MSEQPNCPCQSGDSYSLCCEPLHHGKPAETAEALMRSRYSAFAMHLDDYLLQSWHPETRPSSLNTSGDKTCWHRLEIISSGNNGIQGEVHFRAWYTENNEWHMLEEKSRFFCKDGHWLYHSGDYIPARLKPGRNDLCPCGSGKKVKKCVH